MPASEKSLPCDYFALLGLPRQPWVDPEVLKQKYREAASRRHPDQPRGDSSLFMELGEAVSCLKEPHSRLLHLLAIVFPNAPKGPAGPPDGNLFQSIAAALERARLAQREVRQATSKLSRSAAIAATARIVPELEGLLAEVRSGIRKQENLFRECGAEWAQKGASFWRAQASVARFHAKWQRELEDALFACRNLLASSR